MTSQIPPFQGKGMWYGARRYSEAEWEAVCQQAHHWGMQWVHPKVAEVTQFTRLWYTDEQLRRMAQLAHYYGLKIAPYQYCYGDKFGWIQIEMETAAHAALFFDGYVLDIESEWDHQPGWAITFGAIRKKLPAGYPLVATVFANPGATTHPTPIMEINEWISGFMPQVYFSEWTPQTAQHAIDYINPMWTSLNKAAISWERKPLAPIMHIISVEHNVATGEIEHWMQLTKGYGYCGFWYNVAFDHYAGTVDRVSIPHTNTPINHVSPPVPPIVEPTPLHIPVAPVTAPPPVAAPITVIRTPTPKPEPIADPVIAPAPVVVSDIAQQPTASVPAVPDALNKVLQQAVEGLGTTSDDAWLMAQPYGNAILTAEDEAQIAPTGSKEMSFTNLMRALAATHETELKRLADTAASTTTHIPEGQYDEAHFQLMWQWFHPDAPFDAKHPIVQRWMIHMQEDPTTFGPVTVAIKAYDSGSQVLADLYEYAEFATGRRIVLDKKSNATWVF